MKEVLHLFLCFMISFGLSNGGVQYALEEKAIPVLNVCMYTIGDRCTEQGSYCIEMHGTCREGYEESVDCFKKIMINGEIKSKLCKCCKPKPVAVFIDPKCCNFSTTDRCSRMGTDGFKGHCMPLNETCLGQEYYGSKYCAISKHQSCKCCVPTDCKKQTLNPCITLGGTCIGLNDHCNGTSVVSEDFCKKDSKIDTCKCCFPDDCPCGQNDDGICLGTFPRGHDSDGKMTDGRCMKSCRTGRTSLIDHTCNKTGGKNCKCCALHDSCGKTCVSPKLYNNCICTRLGKPYGCPKGYCVHPDDNMCPEDMCSCCLEKPSECTSILDQCSGRKDYCVEKVSGDCPKGYSKLYNACSKKTVISPDDRTYKQKTAKPGTGVSKVSDCDCCKSTVCSSNGDRCTGRGSFCIENSAKCPDGYVESLDCSRPVIYNGTFIAIQLCKCCKPRHVECPKGCFRVGPQCFLRSNKGGTINQNDAAMVCASLGQTLAEPQEPQALSQYLTTHFEDPSYWIGARGTNNGSTAWASGGVIGPDAPWFGNSYANCAYTFWCMYLQANSACYTSNQCYGCDNCNLQVQKPWPVWVRPRTPLCTCKTKSLYEK